MDYRFQKLYVDLITDDGTVCIVYVAETRFLGRTIPHAGMECYWPDGRREVIRAHVSDGFTPSQDWDASYPITLKIQGGTIHVRVEPTIGAWTPGSKLSPVNSQWSVVFSRARITVQSSRYSEQSVMSGTGYVDRVDMKTRLGRSPYKDVRWGRIHYPDHTVVFNSIQLKDGIQVCNLAKWAVPSTIDTTDQFTVIEKPNVVDLVLPNRTTTLKPIRVLHRGSAFDAVRFPGAFERFFIRTLAGRMSESRYVSRASDSDNADGDPGWALYEHVVFG